MEELPPGPLVVGLGELAPLTLIVTLEMIKVSVVVLAVLVGVGDTVTVLASRPKKELVQPPQTASRNKAAGIFIQFIFSPSIGFI